MTRIKRTPSSTRSASATPTLSPRLQNALSVLLLYVVTLILFRGIIFDNAAFTSGGDTAAALSYTHAGNELEAKEGVDAIWMPFFFSGMPTFGNVAYIPHDVSYLQHVAQQVMNLLYLNGTWTWLVVYYFAGGIFMYFLLITWNFQRPAALIGALTFMLSPYAIGLAEEGHGSKLMALSYLPLIVLLTYLLFSRRDLLSFGLLTAGVGTLFLTRHLQMVYYELALLGLYTVCFVWLEAAKQPRIIVSRAVLFTVALIVGFLISSYISLSVYQYTQYSMRGGGTTGSSGGLALDYATNWSWHPAELVTLLVPGFFGMKADFYWGPMIPWTNSCVYIGLLPLLLAVIAVIYRRTRLVIFFGVTTVFMILVSFGRNFSVLYDLLFAYLPFFNKFRAPEMVLHLLPFTGGILAAAGYGVLLEAKRKDSGIHAKQLARNLLIIGGIIAAVFVLALMFKEGLFDTLSGSLFLKEGEAQQFQQQYGQQAPRAIAQIKEIRFEIFWKDYVKFSLLAIALCMVLGSWLHDKLRESTFAATLLLLLIVDLSMVGGKYIDPKPSRSIEESFRADATVQYLKQQAGIFRVFPLAQLFMDNTYAYHGLQSIGGYSPAKLKIYQTMLDSCMYEGTDPAFPLNMHIVDMLNVEYLLAQGRLPDQTFRLVHADPARRVFTYRNPEALPRAFYVSRILKAENDHGVFQALNDPGFDPRQTAVLYAPFTETIAPVDSSNAPEITSYASRQIEVSTDTPGNALLVLSEIYYPAGWKAFVDGRETKIYRTNFVLRSVVVPGGKHEVVFRFDPPLYHLGWILSNAAWVLTGICIVVGLIRYPPMRRRLGLKAAAQAGHNQANAAS
jgi:hypothetical protein